MGIRTYFLLLLLLQIHGRLHAQTGSAFAGGVSLNVGDLIKIHGEYPSNGLSLAGELQFMWNCNGDKRWMTERGRPLLGMNCVLVDFGNTEVLGKTVALVPQFMRRWSLGSSYFFLRGGLGIGYFNRAYDMNDNPENLVFGSRMANVSNLGTGIGFRVVNQHFIELGGTVIHASNAHVRVPNIGGNIIGLHATWRPGGEAPVTENLWSPSRTEKDSRWYPAIHLGYGLHSFPGTVRPIGGPLYSTVGATMWMTTRRSDLADWSAGIHYHYYSAYEQYALSQELFEADEAIKNAHVVIAFAGREWFFGRFSFFLQAGVNLYSPFLRELNKVWDLPKHGWMYLNLAHKVGYRMYLDDQRTYISMSVKTNGGTADMFEFGLGRVIKSKKAG